MTSDNLNKAVDEILNKHSGALSIGEGDRSEILRVIDIKKIAPHIQTLINNEKIAEHEYIIAKYELMYQRIAKKNGVVRKTPHTAFHQISKTRVAELQATLKKGSE